MPEHPETKNSRFGVAILLSEQERHSEPVPLRRYEFELAAKQNGRDAPGNLKSDIRLEQDRYWTDELEESEQLSREVLAGVANSLEDASSEALAVQHELAKCLPKMGRYSEAISLRRMELAWRIEYKGYDDSETPSLLYWLGEDLVSAGRNKEARQILSRCLEIRRGDLGIVNEDIKSTRESVAQLEKLGSRLFG